MLEVKIHIKGSSKEYTVEIDDKSKFLSEIKSVIENDGIFEFSDDNGAVSYTHLTLPTKA